MLDLDLKDSDFSEDNYFTDVYYLELTSIDKQGNKFVDEIELTDINQFLDLINILKTRYGSTIKTQRPDKCQRSQVEPLQKSKRAK